MASYFFSWRSPTISNLLPSSSSTIHTSRPSRRDRTGGLAAKMPFPAEVSEREVGHFGHGFDAALEIEHTAQLERKIPDCPLDHHNR